jgi:hypothetical protein
MTFTESGGATRDSRASRGVLPLRWVGCVARMIFKCPAYAEARVRNHELFRGIPGAEEAGLDARVQEFVNPRPWLLYPGFWHDMIWLTSWSHML